ncbi:MAG: SdiA-regulated domain-containing protein [Zoogloeaceae bacterium]|nr:SdiA-regulated domain-containing protein [Zoogloeaceae bacterium]
MTRKKFRLAIIALCLLVAPLLSVVWYYRLDTLAWYWFSIAWQKHTHSLRLPAYRVTLDARPIAGITHNLSGLTYNAQTGTLFSVINDPAQIAEITTEGQLLRLIPVTGIDDLEGISHVGDNRFVVIDERSQQICWIQIDAETQSVDATHMPRLGLGVQVNGNLGFEGISWDRNRQRLLVSKEKEPMRIFEIEGLPAWLDGSALNLQIREWLPENELPVFIRDISSLGTHSKTGHVLVLSDESKLLVEYDADKELIGILPLWRGWQRLNRSIPQAEGSTVDPEGNIYIVSEPNLFYRFEHPEGAP